MLTRLGGKVIGQRRTARGSKKAGVGTKNALPELIGKIHGIKNNHISEKGKANCDSVGMNHTCRLPPSDERRLAAAGGHRDWEWRLDSYSNLAAPSG
jgi:hypothetical protein